MKPKPFAIIFIAVLTFGIAVLSTLSSQQNALTGAASAAGISLPALPVVLVTALVDSINPCAIGVLILLISTLLALSKDRKKMLLIGCIYILAVYITYLLAGMGLLLFIQQFNIAEPLGIAVGILVILLGLLEVKDFFWYGRGITLSIPVKRVAQIEHMVKKVSYPGAIILGIFVAAVELPCTGGPYLAITALLSKIGFNLAVFGYLLLYNFIFVIPLLVILTVVYFGFSAKKVQAWKNKERKWMRLATGIIMIALGILLILFANGSIALNLVG